MISIFRKPVVKFYMVRELLMKKEGKVVFPKKGKAIHVTEKFSSKFYTPRMVEAGFVTNVFTTTVERVDE